MSAFLIWMALGIAAGIIWASFFEWTFHRFFMHRPVRGFSYPFQMHALTHHRVFKADETYHLQNPADAHLVPMAWWNGPALIGLCAIPFALVSWLTGRWGLLCGSVASFMAYYAAYEYSHWCMHIPKSRRVERAGIFFRMNGHHLLHHRYMNKNFNVVLPLADFCLRTMLWRSKVRFAQASGPSVPNVQPRHNRPNVDGLLTRETLAKPQRSPRNPVGMTSL